MGKIEFTEDQKSVIEIRDRNVLVSAAAGSGKTAVLTQRIVDRICDKNHPVSIDRLLIVTFTEAAAAEMRERIASAISDRLRQEPGNEHLKKQKTLVHSALIMTVHGFCLYLIRNHFDRIELDPSFRISADKEADLMFEDSLEEAISRMLEENPGIYEDLEDYFNEGYSDNPVRENVKGIYRVAESQPFVEDWLLDMIEKEKEFAKDPERGAASRFGFDYETGMLKECQRMLQTAMDLAKEEGGPKKYLPALQSDLAYVENLLSKNSFEERETVHRAYSFPRIATEKDSDLKRKAQELRNGVKNWITDFRGGFYSVDIRTVFEDEAKTADILIKLLELTLLTHRVYVKNKRKKNLIDFSDMEHLALEILLVKEGKERVKSDVALAYENFFEEVMVDEYQDSNYIQEYLLNAVSRQTETFGNRFMVGDVKQSIYRFRQAKPEIFRNKYDAYSDDREKRDVRIHLSQNFRSRIEVLNSVNCLFEDVMHREIGEIEYDVHARLNLGAVYPETEGNVNKAELLVLPDGAWKEADIKDSVKREAMVVGSRILQMIREKSPVTDREKTPEGETKTFLRPVQYSDIIILIRKAKGVASKLKAVLEGMGIPTMVLSKEGYFTAPEVILVLNMISVIDNPRQDIPLLGVLHSFMGGFGEEELALVKSGRKRLLLYDALKEYSRVGKDGNLREKCTGFLEKLNRYRFLSDRMGVYELMQVLLEEEEVFDHFRALNLGEQRVANLRILMEKAKEFSSTGYAGLSQFVRYIDNMKVREIDFGEANVLDEKANVVRIFTMHKSKGLEFPVCILMGCGDHLKRGGSGPVSTDDALGMGVEFRDPVRRIKHKSITAGSIGLKADTEQKGEDLRLLYVAMTRAKEKLIMVGNATKKLLDATENVGGKRSFSAMEIMSASSFLDLLLPEALRNPGIFEVKTILPEDAKSDMLDRDVDRALLKTELLGLPPMGVFREFQYKNDLENVHTKITVSDLKKEAFEEEEEAVDELYRKEEDLALEKKEVYIPIFMREDQKALPGTHYGTAHHRIMQLLDFSAFSEEELGGGPSAESFEILSKKVKSMRRANVENYFIPEEEDKLVRGEGVVRFLQSPMALRMKKAEEQGKLFREQPFVLSLPAREMDPGLPEDETVLVQGVMDVYFEEDGELVLLDYKTDSKVDDKELLIRHGQQLRYYAMALEKLEGKKVKEIVIYSFYLGKCIYMD